MPPVPGTGRPLQPAAGGFFRGYFYGDLRGGLRGEPESRTAKTLILFSPGRTIRIIRQTDPLQNIGCGSMPAPAPIRSSLQPSCGSYRWHRKRG